MKQSRLDSLMESIVNIIIGLAVSTLANVIFLPIVLGVTPSFSQNVTISVIFTIISLARSYAIRRLFNGRPVWTAIRTALTKKGLFS
jgi:hypothetical protein